MAWSTAYGNKSRSSDAGVATGLSALLWTHSFDLPEQPYGPPIVSVGGYIWIVTQDTTGFDFTFYLYCFAPDGTVVSKRTLQVDDATPHTSGLISSLSTDVALVPWTDRLRAFNTGINADPVQIRPVEYGCLPNAAVTFTVDQACDFVVSGGSLSAASGTSTVWTLPAGAGTYTITATSQSNPLNSTTATVNVNTDSTALWEYTKTVGDPSTRHFDCPAVDGSDNIYQLWDVTSGSNRVCHFSILDSSGGETSTVTLTGFRALSLIACIDDAAFYIPLVDDPLGGGSNVFLKRILFNGSTDWTYSHGGYFTAHRLLTPSYANGKVLVFGEHDAIVGFASTFQLNATTGVLEWTHDGDANDYANGSDPPAIGSDGIVYGGHLNEVPSLTDPTCYAMATADGSQVWKVTETGSTRRGRTAVVGNDGFVLSAADTLYRLTQSGGASSGSLTGISAVLAPALITNRLYVPVGTMPADSGSVPGALLAYGPQSHSFFIPDRPMHQRRLPMGRASIGRAVFLKPQSIPFADACHDNDPQMWIFSSTRLIGRWQETATRDFEVGIDEATGEPIPDWVYSTGFIRRGKPDVIKGVLIDADGTVQVTLAKTVEAANINQARSFEISPQTDQDEVWRQGVADLRAYKHRFEFTGSNDTTLAAAGWSEQDVDAVGG